MVKHGDCFRMLSGKIAKITDKGFGFITPAGGGTDIFFHVSGMIDRGLYDSLQSGDSVTYELTTGPDNRSRAVSVRVID